MSCTSSSLKIANFVAFFLVFGIAVYKTFYPFDPVKPGFVCGDPSLSLSYKPNTIASLTLAVVLYMSVLILVFLTEFCVCKEKSIIIRLKFSLSIAFNFSVKYAFANFLVFILIDIVKHTAGGHRPHFFDVCKPEQCMEGSWIEEFKCTSDASQFEIREASRSMPSGHSQAAVQFAVFLIWYMQRRVTKKEITTFFLPIIHLILLSCASFVCATRIFDHAHHSRDVIAGALIGLVTAVYVCLFMCDNFETSNYVQQQPKAVEAIESRH